MIRTATLAAATLATLAPLAAAAPAGDLVDQLPGFDKAPFDTYSGYLEVPGPVAGYDKLRIAYILNLAQTGAPQDAPVVAWHQGGPGGNSFYGLFGEEGYFQVSDSGQWVNKDNAWNQVANMLYLDAPAGSNDPVGFSECYENGESTPAKICKWDDKSQAEAYAHTLAAFYTAFPEFNDRDLYLTGESYAGQYLPNIATYILDHAPFNSSIPLQGLAVGNGCWGGDANSVVCNGPNSEQNDIDAYYGKGLISRDLYFSTYEACGYNFTNSGDADSGSLLGTGPQLGLKCDLALEEASATVGPHDIYNIYDNCPGASEWHQRSGKSVRWLKNWLRQHMSDPASKAADNRRKLTELAGGYQWPCGGIDDLGDWLQQPDVRKALHFGQPNPVQFDYSTSGPASITLWPRLAKDLRVLIYNGDADDCVPYKGNEEWTTSLKTAGVLKEKHAWHPWYKDEKAKNIPAGYATTYDVVGSEKDFSFITVRLAGHMVPAFRADAAFAFIQRFLSGEAF